MAPNANVIKSTEIQLYWANFIFNFVNFKEFHSKPCGFVLNVCTSCFEFDNNNNEMTMTTTMKNKGDTT